MSQFAPIERPERADWREPLAELETIARAVARGAPPNRSDATAYLDARVALLGSEVAEILPGFLLQCHSILRLREFLLLYDPSPEMRETFMARAFERCRAAIGEVRRTPLREPRRGPTPPPAEWMS